MGKEVDFRCEKCSKSFSRKYNLDRHHCKEGKVNYGECMTREHLNIKDESIFKLKFKAGYENEDDDDDSDVDDVNSDNHGEDLVNDNIEEVMEYEARNLILFEIITPDSYIGLRSQPESLELFFAAKVVSKDIATDYIEDTNGHGILPGEHYVTVQYLEKDKESFSQVQYKLVKKGYSFIHLGEIFETKLFVESSSNKHNSYIILLYFI